MVAGDRLRAWLRQARADLDAGRADGGSECHRRYWLQQACEKSIKALGMVLWNGPQEHESAFRSLFLHRHSPLSDLEKGLADVPDVPKALRLLLRQLDAEIGKLDGDGLLRKVDSTATSKDPAATSYRYPFRDATGHDVAPQDWGRADWDAYQGNAAGVTAALDRFIRAVENRRQRARGAG
jgi:hypothetical protein